MGFNALKTARGGAVWALGLILLALSACGGGSGNGDAPVAEVKANTAPSKTLPTPEQTRALLKKGAALNTAELARAAEAAATIEGATNAKAGAKTTTKAAASASLVTVYRFFNNQTDAHFYTASETEKATVLATMPQFHLDGAAFQASGAAAPGLSPVHRFFNTQTGVHFYTISEDEKALVQASLPQFHYDGVAYHASKVASTGLTPLYRFYYTSKGIHFYTSSESERVSIVASYKQYSPEGIGYFVEQVPPPCIAPECLPPADRPAQTNSKNVFWLRTDSSTFDWLTSNQLIYSESVVASPRNSYDASFTFFPDGNRVFIRPGVNVAPVYQADYIVQNVVDSNAVYKLGLNQYASRHGEFNPALEVGTVGRGCNTSDGAFYLHELESAADGKLIKFAADFTVRCEGSENVNGALRYNSIVPSVVPQVFANAGSDMAVQEGSGFPLLGNLSWSPSSKIKSAQWTQVSGPPLDLSQCGQLACNTYAPLLPAGGATAVLKLTVKTESGLVGSDTVNVQIRSSLDKQTRLDFWGDGFASRAVGGGLHLNDLGGRMQVPTLNSLGSIYQNQTSERVNVIARGRTQSGGTLSTGISMEFMSKAGEPLVPGQYSDLGTGSGFEALPNSASVHVSAEGAGCGHNLATMHVGDIQRDALDFGKISSLSIFAQTNCIDAGLDEATYTRLWINHQPVNIPAAAITGLTQGRPGQKIVLSSNASFARKGTVVAKVWRIVFSTANASLSDAVGDTISLNLGGNAPSGSKTIVSMEVFDSSGDSGIVLHTVTVP